MLRIFRQNIIYFLRNDGVLPRIFRNSGWMLLANLISATLLLVQAVIITRALGTTQYGILVLITTYVLIINQLIDSRVWEAAIKFIPHYREQGQIGKATAVLKLFYLVDAIGSVIALFVIVVTSGLAAQVFLKDTASADLVKLYSLIVIIDFSTETSSALLRINNRFKWIMYQSISEAAIKTIGVLIVWMIGATIERILLSMLITSAVGVLIMQIMAYRVARNMNLTAWIASPLGVLRDDFRMIFSFIFFSNLTTTSRLITSKIDILFLGWFAAPVQVGLYELAKRLVNQVTTLLTPFYTTIYPEISNLIAQGKYVQVRSLQTRLSKSIFALIFPMCILFSIGVVWIIPTIFGQEYAPAIPLAQIMAWSLVWTPLIWFPGFLLSLGRARTQAAITWIDALIYLSLLLIMIPVLNGLGAAIATLLRFIIWIGMVFGVLNYLDRTHWDSRKEEP